MIDMHIYTGENAIDELVRFLASRSVRRTTIVADDNTHAALGAQVEVALSLAGVAVTYIVLPGDVIGDERTMMQVFVRVDTSSDLLISIGSGTLTDIVRFAAHLMRRPFVAMTTAPSMDGYASGGAPLVVLGVKQTYQVEPPVAVISHLPTLCHAPQGMIAAGLGDMLGKYTAAADWRLGVLLWGEPWDEVAANRTRRALDRCVSHAQQLRTAEPEAVAALIDGLLESGLSMSDAGHSRPASGMEHHVSHYWEMKLLAEGRHAVLHGTKVGVATIASAAVWRIVRCMSGADFQARLAAATWPDPVEERARLVAAFGGAAEGVIREHRAFLSLSPEAFAALVQLAATSWQQIREIAATVPEPAEMREVLAATGGPVTVEALGLSDEEGVLGVRFGHYLRNRFTVAKLAWLLGLLNEPDTITGLWKG